MIADAEHDILHVVCLDKFIPPFIDFVERHFDDFEKRHVFWIEGDSDQYPVARRPNTLFASDYTRPGKYRALLGALYRADKIILHNLFYFRLVQMLSLQPWLLTKCHWVIWGGDLYHYKLGKRDLQWRWQEIFRRSAIKRMGHLVSWIEGDVDLARQWYGARGQYHECLTYTSNLFREAEEQKKSDGVIRILVGNSATESNAHIDILSALERYRDEDIEIYAPLSYGDPEYARKVSEAGKCAFGEKFVPVTKFMRFDEYMRFLSGMDMAIFNHSRQQGLGNTVALLGMGKTVYMRQDVTPWKYFERKGVTVLDWNEFRLELLDEARSRSNMETIRRCHSEEALRAQLARLFGEQPGAADASAPAECSAVRSDV